MEAFFFGQRRKLFGAYHAARSDVARDAGVVLCAPFGDEYMRAHRALLDLATTLADAGLHVLRFDYTGCGDSEGDLEEATLTNWREDVVTACQELSGGVGVPSVSLVGVRLGASIAALATADTPIADLVLWDPVVDGAGYVASLSRKTDAFFETSFAERRGTRGGVWEALGYGASTALRCELAAVDLTRVQIHVARSLLVDVLGDERVAALARQLSDAGRRVCYERKREPAIWRKVEQLAVGSVPAHTMARLVSGWLSETGDAPNDMATAFQATT